MLALLWAQQIMLGRKTTAHVPAQLPKDVMDILIASGYMT